ncbi:MAG TPA: DUF4105 domain-containing protein [Gemmatimonadales bacterium]|nr:DUF4105 domain-containing protein [Gemmatimonadales bacterium]
MAPRRRWTLSLVAGLGLAWVGFLLVTHPSNDRDWVPNERVLPYAEFDGDLVRIHNVRNTAYRTAEDFTPAYYDTTLDLARLRTVWFSVVPFATWTGAAHTFLSFGFDGARGPTFLAVSVEARKERGEGYDPVKGMFRRYEIMYVVADERDAIRLRANYRHDDVFLYPIKATHAGVRALFVAMLERANRLRAEPEFYNTLTNNCTNTIAKHVNSLSPHRIPFSLKIVFPAYADRLAYDLGLIDTDLPYDSIRPHFRINERAMQYADSVDFSIRIRERASMP